LHILSKYELIYIRIQKLAISWKEEWKITIKHVKFIYEIHINVAGFLSDALGYLFNLLRTLSSAGVLLGLLQRLSNEELSHSLRAELSHVRAVRVHLTSNHHWVEAVRHRNRPEQLVDVLVGECGLVLRLSGSVFLRLHSDWNEYHGFLKWIDFRTLFCTYLYLSCCCLSTCCWCRLNLMASWFNSSTLSIVLLM
jgi:hypothetical protein